MLPTQCLPNHHTLTPKRAQNGVVVEPELLADGDARESPAVELNSPRYIHKLHPSGRVDSTRSQVLRDRCSAHPELAGDAINKASDADAKIEGRERRRRAREFREATGVIDANELYAAGGEGVETEGEEEEEEVRKEAGDAGPTHAHD